MSNNKSIATHSNISKSRFSAKTILNELGHRANKLRGQNFLSNKRQAEKIALFFGLNKSETILEIGPGLGALTEQLSEYVDRLYLVEIEKSFCDYLEKSIPNLRPNNIFCSDIRDFKLSRIHDDDKPVTVYSNVPYSISTEVILWLFSNREHISRAVLLLQKEFALRLIAKAGSKEYGSLTVLRELYCDAKKGFVIKGNDFFPSADVESLLIELTFLDNPRVPILEEESFTNLVRAAFASRRKTLINNLMQYLEVRSKEELVQLLDLNGIDGTRRAETLTLQEFWTIFKLFE
jgi:16S rRNA (adenine1518-N6/adenine1519-N6)-dimethyltransferase